MHTTGSHARTTTLTNPTADPSLRSAGVGAIAVAAAACVLCSLASEASGGGASAFDHSLRTNTGDLNGDGATDSEDLRLLLLALQSPVDAPAFYDVNHDGKVDQQDLVWLMEEISGSLKVRHATAESRREFGGLMSIVRRQQEAFTPSAIGQAVASASVLD